MTTVPQRPPVRVYRIPTDVIAHFQTEFLKFDVNETGRIFCKECRVLVRQLGLDPQDSFMLSVLKRADEAQQSKVRYEQFIEIVHKQMVGLISSESVL